MHIFICHPDKIKAIFTLLNRTLNNNEIVYFGETLNRVLIELDPSEVLLIRLVYPEVRVFEIPKPKSESQISISDS